MRRRLAISAHAGIWWALTLAFLAVGAPEIYRGAVGQSLHNVSPFHSTDSYLRFTTEAPVSSQLLMELFAELPSSQSVLILRSDEASSSLLGMVAAYLAAPHPVSLLDPASEEGRAKMVKIDPAKASTFVLCRITRPASIPPGRKLGRMEIGSVMTARP